MWFMGPRVSGFEDGDGTGLDGRLRVKTSSERLTLLADRTLNGETSRRLSSKISNEIRDVGKLILEAHEIVDPIDRGCSPRE
jgi:hypothetical protein